MRFLCTLLLLTIGLSQINAIDFITINYNNNPANNNGYGSINYTYNISKYEITNILYCEFLNCVADRSDIYNLYSPLMEQHFLGGIIRKKINNKYQYSCKTGYENKPVTAVTWMSAIRFTNWLHYNAENIEKGTPIKLWTKSTEGDETHGAYNTKIIPEERNCSAIYWLPNRSEWEKAAYYDGEKWIENHTDKNANCYNSTSGWALKYPHISDVGLCKGPNGTYDQQGNVAEWVENSQGNWKLALGGSLIRPENFAFCGITEGDDPEKSIITFGFRVCQTVDTTARNSTPPIYIPEHSSCSGIDYNNKTDLLGNNYVLVSDANNPGDIINQYKGSVPYEYYIAKTELTNKSYCEFLNSVATHSDPYNLYNENMGNSVCGGIEREINDNGVYSYTCKKEWENKPVVYICYYDLARYANWLHYGCPKTGFSELGTTEGDEIQGAYSTVDFESVRLGKTPPYKDFGKRNIGAKFWIPDENEWYKAAYYDPTLIGNRKYHDYPTRSSNAPSQEEANYVINNELNIGEPFFVADVDSFSLSPSFYGTLQQGGNVWEWIESWQYGKTGERGLKGGSWSYNLFGLNACNTDPGGINDRSYVFGGRLCMTHDENGWQPHKKKILQDIYENIILLPKSRIILLILYSICMSAIVITYIIYRIINHLCKRK